ncbi:SDR family NAD(P)-dependent oxidoreductase [Xanthomonas hortorum]|nr:SDR family NAD(P)-dependent oxidoreductase [Xanthomonas hortorum]
MTELQTNLRFAGRTAIVTGAGSGIGRAVAVRLAREGANIVAADLFKDRLDALADELGPDRTAIVVGDISKEETVQAVITAANGRVDALANIAGVMDGFLPVGEVDDATWEKVFAINVTAVMRLTRAALPLMLAAGKGAIVNVASEAGLRGSAAGVAYTASKHALIGLTRNTAFMYGPSGLRVNAIAPGAVQTGIDGQMKSSLAADRVGALLKVIVPSAATPEQIAAGISWLLSDDSANVTGIVMPSDGGWSAA